MLSPQLNESIDSLTHFYRVFIPILFATDIIFVA